ncbi:MAG TPA: 2Fe-2S iron-sulfur cluster-binding protein [Blastocatellia bacterium]
MPKLIIDDKEVEAPAGATIIQAAKQIDIDIPHYCYHEDLPIDGNCRMCLVEVEKMPKLTIACATVVADGMVVRTKSDKVKEAVRGVLEFLLINHPVDCPICDQAGECRLQDYYMVYGLHTSEIPLDMKVRKHKAVDLGSMVVLDSERCVLCSRCIRFFNHVTQTGEMQFFGRGDHVEIGTFENRPLDNPYSGNVVDVCPVGALTSRDFRFKCRVWFLYSTNSVCGGCSTGCNVRIDHRDGTIFRLIPLRNPEVNKSWMCDEGRLTYHQLTAGDRVRLPAVRGRDGMQAPVKWEAAISQIDSGLREIAERFGPDSILGFASPSATNEALFLFKRYLADHVGTSRFEFRLGSEDKDATTKEDEILRHVDKHPNSLGAVNLGLSNGEGTGLQDIMERVQDASIRAALIIYLKPLVKRPHDELIEARLAELVGALDFSVVMTSHKMEWLSQASVVLPVAQWSEEEGTYTNYQGRVQAAGPAISPGGEILPIWQVMSLLLKARGAAAPWSSPLEIFAAMAESVPTFQGMTHESTRLPGGSAYS